jgi:hypothetical protein
MKQHFFSLTFKQWGGYLNFSVCSTKNMNVICDKKKVKFRNEWHFMVNKAEILQYILKIH